MSGGESRGNGPIGRKGGGSRPARARPRAIIVAVIPPTAEDHTGEMAELLRTAGVLTVGQVFQRRERPEPSTYVGPGKLIDLRSALIKADANLIACDGELTPRQERNLETALRVPVVDRTAVILDIFAAHARSSEGKLQVELAQLQYNLARMRGLWSHLERLGGGIGTRGPGESQIETDRRLARERITTIRRRLASVQRTRTVMRSERERAWWPEVALVGYTNVGKSTLLNALAGATVPVRDRLFQTLDPTTRIVRTDGRRYLLTDTVGFIRKLPHQLVDAFRATLEETRRADLLLHVVDGSASEDEVIQRTAAVEDVLTAIDANVAPRLTVLAKADLIDEERRRELAFRHPDAVLISAATGEGLETLTARIQAEFEPRMRAVALLIPYAHGRRLAELYEVAGHLVREDTPDGVLVRALLSPSVIEVYAPFVVDCRQVERPRCAPLAEEKQCTQAVS